MSGVAGLSARRILIVGGGLAGLATALALGRRGAECVLIDQHGPAEGAAIAITNRAVDALEELGVLDACVAAGNVPQGSGSIFAALMDGAGNPLPVPPTPARPDARLPGVVSVYRPELTRILTEAAGAAGADIRHGLTFTTMIDQGDEVTVAFSDGTKATFDLVIGADGTRSSVRALTHGDIRPTYTGWMSFRLVLEDGPPGDAGFFVLPDSDMAVTTRLPGNLLYLASGMKMQNRRLDQDEARLLLRDVLDRFTAPLIRGIIARLDGDPAVIARPFEWLKVPAPWHRGRIMVLGDAAHSTTAHLSSGGSMALEDAVVLAQELATDDLAAGLGRFASRRAPRTSFVVDTSVALLKMQEVNASPAESGRLRSEAISTLMRPY